MQFPSTNRKIDELNFFPTISFFLFTNEPHNRKIFSDINICKECKFKSIMFTEAISSALIYAHKITILILRRSIKLVTNIYQTKRNSDREDHTKAHGNKFQYKFSRVNHGTL